MVFSRVVKMGRVRDYRGQGACDKMVFTRVVMIGIARDKRRLVARWPSPG